MAEYGDRDKPEVERRGRGKGRVSRFFLRLNERFIYLYDFRARGTRDWGVLAVGGTMLCPLPFAAYELQFHDSTVRSRHPARGVAGIHDKISVLHHHTIIKFTMIGQD